MERQRYSNTTEWLKLEKIIISMHKEKNSPGCFNALCKREKREY